KTQDFIMIEGKFRHFVHIKPLSLTHIVCHRFYLVFNLVIPYQGHISYRKNSTFRVTLESGKSGQLLQINVFQPRMFVSYPVYSIFHLFILIDKITRHCPPITIRVLVALCEQYFELTIMKGKDQTIYCKKRQHM